MRRRIAVAGALAALVWLTGAARADVKPHALVSDGMVLQQGMKCPIWGTADPSEEVSAVLDTGDKEGADGKANAQTVTADKKGKWLIRLPEMKAGGPYRLKLSGKNKLTIKDVYVGEVWIASGQSNMEWPLRLTVGAKEAIATSKNPKVRLFTVPKATSLKPLTEVNAKWVACGPSTVPNFSAVAYYFGRDLHKARQVPVGLIHTSWGGTIAEAWTGRKALEAEPSLKHLIPNPNKAIDAYLAKLEVYLAQAKKARAAEQPVGPPPPYPATKGNNPNRGTVLFNAMIKPLQPYAIRGAIWYQGESNAGRAYQYRTLFPTMIQNWRKTWGEGDFPFLFVQLAPWRAISKEPMESDWAELREAQLLTSLHLKNAGMAVITDVGEERDIHPRKKGPVGARLALAARALAYGEKITYSGPLYDSMKIEGDKVVLNFKHVGKGLEARSGSELKGFTIAGPDHKFHNAQAEIKGDTVVVWSDAVKKPVAVRYGWAHFPVVNLFNKEGLPASPFRTDDFVTLTGPKNPAPKLPKPKSK